MRALGCRELVPLGHCKGGELALKVIDCGGKVAHSGFGGGGPLSVLGYAFNERAGVIRVLLDGLVGEALSLLRGGWASAFTEHALVLFYHEHTKI